MIRKIQDGLRNFYSDLTNNRASYNRNDYVEKYIDRKQLRAIYKSGLGSKIVRIKSSYSLNDAIEFDSTNDQSIYDNKLLKCIRKSSEFMLAFGRSLLVIYEPGANLSEPRRNTEPYDIDKCKIRVFSGDIVNVSHVITDFNSPDYYKPIMYTVRGLLVHPSRVVDFTYYDPEEQSMPDYQYGGISEYELIYDEIINDAVTTRSVGALMETASRRYMKVAGFRDAVGSNNHTHLVEAFRISEDAASIMGTTLIDAEDDVAVHDQTMNNLADANSISLQRIALGTGIPIPILVGENVKGLNSSGDNERKAFQDTIRTFQKTYLIDKIVRLCRLFGLGEPQLCDNQGGTPKEDVEYEATLMANAMVMREAGLDYEKYLEDKGFAYTSKFDPSDMFRENDLPEPVPVGENEASTNGE